MLKSTAKNSADTSKVYDLHLAPMVGSGFNSLISHDPMGHSMVRFQEQEEEAVKDDFTDMRDETVQNQDLLAVDDSHEEQMTVEH